MRERRYRAWYHDIGMKYNVNPLHKADEVMDFIGSQDENGRDIYEGDIVTVGVKRDYVGIVFYAIGLGMYVVKQDMIDDGCYHFGTYDISEVIGNIYENPELKPI